MTICNLEQAYAELTAVLTSRIKELNHGKVPKFPSFDPPANPTEFAVWLVLDQAGNKVCTRICVRFRKLVSFLGFEPEFTNTLPDKLVWFTAKAEEPSYWDLVPKLDLQFRPHPAHVNTLIDVLMLNCQPGYGRAYYGFGPAGCGKTSTPTWLLALLRQQCVTFNVTHSIEPEEILLRVLPSSDGSGRWQQSEGPLLQAVKLNCPIIVDELDLAPASLLPSLNDLVERRTFFVQGMGTIQAGNGFKLIGLGNTFGADTDYKGRSVMDRSFADRLYIDRYEALGKELYQGIIDRKYPDLDPILANSFASFAERMQLSAITDLGGYMSPRTLISLIDQFLANKDYYKFPLMRALELTMGSIAYDKELREAVLNYVHLDFPISDSAPAPAKQWDLRYELLIPAAELSLPLESAKDAA